MARVETVKCDQCEARAAQLETLPINGAHMIRSIDVRRVIQSSESKPIARLEKWAGQVLKNRIEQAEAKAALQEFIELD